MDNYKLTYFNVRGIVEPVRFMFKYAKVPFEDNQVDFTKWPEVKKDFKWGQVPVLEYNGKSLTQSVAIANFLAKKFKLLREDIWEQAKCEEVIGAVVDLRLHVRPLLVLKFGGDPEEAAKLTEKLRTTTAPPFLKGLNETVKELKGSKPSTDLIFGDDKPNIADFFLAHFTQQWQQTLGADILSEYPELQKHQKAVISLPGVAEYVAERPETII